MKEVVVGIIPRNTTSEEGEYLLMSSKKDFGNFTGLYYPPGGHHKKGEDEKTTLVREIKEELGVHVVPVRRLATTPSDVTGQITYWWLCEALSEKQNFVIQKEEVADVRYFSSKEIEEGSKLWPATRKFFEEYIFSKK